MALNKSTQRTPAAPLNSTFTRMIMWPILLVSYGSVFAAAVHTVLRNWSGAASLGMLFAVFIGSPSSVGYATYLWRKNLIRGLVRVEAAFCFMLPVCILLLLAVAFKFGR